MTARASAKYARSDRAYSKTEMDLITSNILTIITFTPAAGAVLLLVFKRENVRAIRTFAVIVTVLAFIFSLHLIAHFDTKSADFQFAIKVPWISSFGID